MSEIAVITGGTSGIGRATALYLRDAGYTVYELSRREQGVEGLHHIRCDITNEDQVRSAVAEIMDRAGRIDVLVNNAGFGISGAVEFTDTAEAQRLLDVNFFGMVRMNKAVIPHMRQAGRGRIVNLSSVAAPCPIPFQAYYSAGKAAVNAYTMALANELRPFGITVCAVQPGDIHTGFTAARVKTMEGDDVYGGRIGRSVQRMEHDEQNGMDPAKAGAFIARVANPEDYRDHPYQDLALGELADPERIVLAKNGREKSVFEKGSDAYEHLTTMIRSLMEAELDRNEQIEELGRKLDQTMVYMKLDEGTYLIYEYPADSYAPVYFSISDYPDDLLVCLASADPRDDVSPLCFTGVREVRDYLNSL